MGKYVTKEEFAELTDQINELKRLKHELKRLAFKAGFLAAAAVYKPFECPSTVDKREEKAWNQLQNYN